MLRDSTLHVFLSVIRFDIIIYKVVQILLDYLTVEIVKVGIEEKH